MFLKQFSAKICNLSAYSRCRYTLQKQLILKVTVRLKNSMMKNGLRPYENDYKLHETQTTNHKFKVR